MPELPGLETIGPVGIFVLAIVWLLREPIGARLGAQKPKHPVEVAMGELLELNKRQAENFATNNRMFEIMGEQVKALVDLGGKQLDVLKDIKRGLE